MPMKKQRHTFFYSRQSQKNGKGNLRKFETQCRLRALLDTRKPPQPTWTCFICEKTFESKNGLRKHKKRKNCVWASCVIFLSFYFYAEISRLDVKTGEENIHTNSNSSFLEGEIVLNFHTLWALLGRYLCSPSHIRVNFGVLMSP